MMAIDYYIDAKDIPNSGVTKTLDFEVVVTEMVVFEAVVTRTFQSFGFFSWYHAIFFSISCRMSETS